MYQKIPAIFNMWSLTYKLGDIPDISAISDILKVSDVNNLSSYSDD